jgi:hypothetical protein
MWLVDQILHAAADAIRMEDARLADEQAHRGVDAMDECDLHPVLAAGFAACGLGVLREQRYPAEWRGKKGKRRDLPDDPDRLRCDLVLTPRPGQVLLDSLQAAREEAAARAKVAGTLFEPVAVVEPAPPAESVSAADAYWLEVKVVGQFCYTSGVPGPNSTYASQLIRGVTGDIRKLRDDPGIMHGGMLLVLFASDDFVVEHDLLQVSHRCLDRELPIRSPVQATIGIGDHIGNRRCAVWLADVAKG